MHGIAAEDDETPGQESDTHDDGCCDAQRIEAKDSDVCDINIIRDDDEETSAESDEAERACARGLACQYGTFGPDEASQEHREEELAEHDDAGINEL